MCLILLRSLLNFTQSHELRQKPIKLLLLLLFFWWRNIKFFRNFIWFFFVFLFILHLFVWILFLLLIFSFFIRPGRFFLFFFQYEERGSILENLVPFLFVLSELLFGLKIGIDGNRAACLHKNIEVDFPLHVYCFIENFRCFQSVIMGKHFETNDVKITSLNF